MFANQKSITKQLILFLLFNIFIFADQINKLNLIKFNVAAELLAKSLVNQQQITTTTTTSTISPPFELPDFSEPIGNHTVPLGRDAQLSCKIHKLANFRTAWLKVEDKGILTIHNNVITRNYRFGLINSNDDQGNTFTLTIKNVQASDRGRYMCQINSVPMKYAVGYLDVLTPPIFDNDNNLADKSDRSGFEVTTIIPAGPIIVTEGGNATLSCKASGHPEPVITWRREDNQAILFDGHLTPEQQQQISINKYEGSSIQLTNISKLNSGAYLCIASNGVQPAASKRQVLDVQYSPIVRLPEKEIGATLGQSSKLSCIIEANPTGSYHWLKLASDSSTSLEVGRVDEDELSLVERGDELLNSDKFEIVIKHISSDKVEMTLNLRNIEKHDYAWYKCVGRNSLGIRSGSIRLYESTSFSFNEMLNRAIGAKDKDRDRDATIVQAGLSELNDQAESEQSKATSGRQSGSSRAHTRSSWIHRPNGGSRLTSEQQSSPVLLGNKSDRSVGSSGSRQTPDMKVSFSWLMIIIGIQMYLRLDFIGVLSQMS